MGRSGRTALVERLPGLRRRLALDFVVVNTENAAGGFGVTPRIAEQGAGEEPALADGFIELDRRTYGAAQIGILRFH